MYNLLDKLSKEFNVDHYDDYYLIYEWKNPVNFTGFFVI
jgi:hypothetical protein